MRLPESYTKKWLIYISSFFILSASILLVAEYYHEKKFRILALNSRLDIYATITEGYLNRYDMVGRNDFSMMDSILTLFSNKYVRITLIDDTGEVLYDSQVKNPEKMENHLQRPEVKAADSRPFGTDIRLSESTKVKYYYFARYYGDHYIRISDLYESARNFLQPSRILIIFFIILLLTLSLIFLITASRYGRSINTLKDFAQHASSNIPFDSKPNFPSNELGSLGQELVDIYQNLNHTKEQLAAEKSKLIRHLNLIDEGIAIFSKERELISGNNNFVRLINYISENRVFSAEDFLRIPEFTSITAFLDRLKSTVTIEEDSQAPVYEMRIRKGGKYFSVKCIVFNDRTFEISISDISKHTKRKILKQQLTENIAHELKTPVSSIKGFLETIIEGKPDAEKTMEYIKRAYSQSVRLANLIRDISLLTKMEEAGNLYHIGEVNLSELVADIILEVEPFLKEKNIDVNNNLPENLMINGNTELLYSVFRNFFDNTIHHAGSNIHIQIENYLTDDGFLYFSFSDTGNGVPEDDLPRLFERFYRVEKGRDRKKGGTGLGLAIVRNAITFHRGEISVKNRTEGGLEFLFTLSRKL